MFEGKARPNVGLNAVCEDDGVVTAMTLAERIAGRSSVG